MKSLLICALFIGIFAAFAYAGNDYSWGIITDKDVLISNSTVRTVSRPFIRTAKKLVFKQKLKDPYTIVAIKVTDQKIIGGATVTILSGGVGSQNVTLLFKSERGKSINDQVEIYGR